MEESPWLWGYAAALGVSLVLCFVCTDLLVRRQYRDFPEQWEADGRPKGIFFFPPNSNKTVWTFLKWILATPDWVREAEMTATLWALRIGFVGWNGGILLGFVLGQWS